MGEGAAFGPPDPAGKIAADLAPGEVTHGLLHVIRLSINTIRRLIEAEAAHPTRKEQREALAEVAKLASDLARKLQDPSIVAWLRRDADAAKAAEAILDAAPKLARGAEARATALPKGKGRAADWPAPGGLDARGMCARCAALLWRAIRREPPSAYAREVQRLCDDIWQAAGGRPSRQALASWRFPLQAALPTLTGSPPDDWERRIATINLPSERK